MEKIEKEKNFLAEKFNDAQREIEILKENNKQNLIKIDELLQENLKTAEYKRHFEIKNLEYCDLRNSKDEKIFNLNLEKEKILEKLELAIDKNKQFSFVQSENEKLKNKLKELSMLKEKSAGFSILENTIESKERIIDSLNKEKFSLVLKLEKIEEEVSSEKKKNFFVTKELEDLTENFKNLNKDYTEVKKVLNRNSIKIEDELKVFGIEEENNDTKKGKDLLDKSSENSEEKIGRISRFRKKNNKMRFNKEKNESELSDDFEENEIKKNDKSLISDINEDNKGVMLNSIFCEKNSMPISNINSNNINKIIKFFS